MNYLLDTCVLSEARRKKANPNLIQWLASIDESRMFISALTLGEIQKGINKLGAADKKDKLTTWLEQDLHARFENRILAIDSDIALVWGILTATREKEGIPLPVIDGLIAATACHNNLTLVTRNITDFIRLQLKLVNPWNSADSI